MNPWVIVVALVAWIGSLVAVGMWQNDAGHTAEKTAWQARENKELVDANAEIIRLQGLKSKVEADNKAAVAAIAGQLETEKRAHAKTRLDRDAALRSGAERVSVAVTGCEGVAGATTSGAGTDAAEHPAARGFLHPQVAADLEQLAGDADDAVLELNACIAVNESNLGAMAKYREGLRSP